MKKTLLITGGTGSFGKAVLKKYLKSTFDEIRVFSRDELKQDDMRRQFNDQKLKFFIGDVRDPSSIDLALKNVDYVFHAAALKQVPSCEFFPLEAYKTNVIGTHNVISSSIKNKVKKVICLSTDKAVYPINAMGVSKAMMEKIAISESNHSVSTQISVTRYGNVLSSRGSIVPLVINKILNKENIPVTSKLMTRFIMTLEDAVNLVNYAFKSKKQGYIYVKKSPSCYIIDLVEALIEIFQYKKSKIKIIGKRHGEKNYESLLSNEEYNRAFENKSFFSIPPDNRNLNYENFFDNGLRISNNEKSYSSNSVKLLKKQQLINILSKLPSIKKLIH